MTLPNLASVCCQVYGSHRQPELYVYVRQGLSPDTLPDDLRLHAGVLREVMTLTLSPERRLARADVTQVIQAVRDTGYYVQLPPGGQIAASLYRGD